MILQAITVSRTTFVEAVRQPVLLLMVLGSGALQVFNTWNTGFAMGQEETSEVVGDNKLLLDIGLATIFVFGALLAGFLATAVMSREIENKTVLTIISKPVSRWVLVLGKFFGVAAAIFAGMVVMLMFLLFAIRHGVMSTASDELDAPVLLFALGSVALSTLFSAWCNYFYNWNFSQTAMLLLVPLSVVGYICVLFIGKEWKVQTLGTDLKPQILIACMCLMMAVLVLVSVAVAVSTRLGQVMTIVVCFGIFLLSLFSNYLFGKRVFQNELIATISSVKAMDPEKSSFLDAETVLTLELETAAKRPLPPGTLFYYSPSPSGYPMMTSGEYTPYTGDLTSGGAMMSQGVGPAIVITEARPPYKTLTIRNVGAQGVPIVRPPEVGDYVFIKPTEVNRGAWVVWGGLPNLHFYWLLDAISQNRPVSPAYFGSAAMYALAQICVFLSIGVMLFQRRDVG